MFGVDVIEMGKRKSLKKESKARKSAGVIITRPLETVNMILKKNLMKTQENIRNGR